MEQNNEKEILNTKEKTNWKFLAISISFVLLLIVIAISVTYAYFRVTTTKSETVSNVSALMECMEFEYGESDTIELDYTYPISDDFALANVEPLSVMVANYCTENVGDINYTLTFSTFSIAGDEESFLNGDQIRMHITKIEDVDLDTGEPYEEKEFFKTNYLNTISKLPEGNAMTYIDTVINMMLDTTNYKEDGIIVDHYAIDNDSIGNNKGTLYNIYFWVDYYEGDTTHTGLNDNTTQGKQFLATVNMAINP